MSEPDKRFSYFNQRWLDFTGRTIDEDLGDSRAAGVPHEDLQRCLKTHLTAFTAREPFEMEYRLRRHDRQYRWTIDHGIPRSAANGAFARYIESCLDVTERKQVELELQEQQGPVRRSQGNPRRS